MSVGARCSAEVVKLLFSGKPCPVVLKSFAAALLKEAGCLVGRKPAARKGSQKEITLMSMVRGLGRRERAARKCHFRGTIYICGSGPESGTYKLGRKKYRTLLTRSLSASSSASSGKKNLASREATDGVRVVEAEIQEPARAGAPMVGPETVSSPSRSE